MQQQSKLTKQFIECFNKLDPKIQTLARKSFELWKEDPSHVKFKKLKASAQHDIYSAQVGDHFRSICYKEKETGQYVWFWVGSHAEFDLKCNVNKNAVLQNTAQRIQQHREIIQRVQHIREQGLSHHMSAKEKKTI